MNEATTEIIRRLDGLAPKLALVLGSGLGDLVDKIINPIEMPFGDLPGFPKSGVSALANSAMRWRQPPQGVTPGIFSAITAISTILVWPLLIMLEMADVSAHHPSG